MAASMNKVFLMGNLTRDVELRYIPSGTAVADVGMAVNEKRKGADGKTTESTTFVDVTMWGRTAEIAAEYLKKGSPLLVEGKLQLDQWETPDGEKRQKLRVVCTQLQLLGTKGTGNGGAKAAAPDSDTPASDEPPADGGGEDIPF